ncbi:MAG: flavoprotein [Planctomycetia bacterium]|nr:flavoprotein [Planctomycetia bacterium]
MRSYEILVGVSAGIAAYKTCSLVSRLRQNGFGVSVAMTKNATELIAPKTFEALSGRPVLVHLFDERRDAIPHIEPARRADVFCIAPATANVIAKAANGIADDFLSTLILAFSGPLILAPAMNCEMWRKPAVQRNVAQLREDGVIFVGPEEGHLACGENGVGRMSVPDVIFDKICQTLSGIK